MIYIVYLYINRLDRSIIFFLEAVLDKRGLKVIYTCFSNENSALSIRSFAFHLAKSSSV